MLFRYWINNKLYTFYLHSANYIKIVRYDTAQAFFVKVNPIDGYRIKINKRSVSAADGARGLFSFLGDCVKNDFMTVYADKIIQNFCN